MHRSEWQTLARTRLRESAALISASEWSGAYYLGGYAVEAGLKACLVRQFRSNAMPDKNLVQKAHTHSLTELVKLSSLETSLNSAFEGDPLFQINWAVAKDWNETSRYRVWAERDAKDLVEAIANRQHGVLKWVRQHW